MMKKVMIIDDDPANIIALKAVLTAKGWSALSALSASSGIDMLEQDDSVGIVLLDMSMPGTDGFETISIIRGHEKLSDLPLIAVTAHAMRGDREKCLAAGANEYVAKPIDVNRLVELLHQYSIQ